MTALTAADYADTGQWRLIIKVWPTGMSAHLENTLHDDVEAAELFTSAWDPNPDTLLEHIENAVYDHPRVLDDFSARIIIYDRRTAFMPSELLEGADADEEGWYTAMYEARGSDIMYVTDRGLTAAHSLAPGLKDFLGRTFPGARISCNLMEQVSRLRGDGGLRLCVEARPDEADYILLDGDNLISASTHGWFDPTDIVYHAFNLLDVYGVNPKEVMICAGGAALPQQSAEMFTQMINAQAAE